MYVIFNFYQKTENDLQWFRINNERLESERRANEDRANYFEKMVCVCNCTIQNYPPTNFSVNLLGFLCKNNSQVYRVIVGLHL